MTSTPSDRDPSTYGGDDLNLNKIDETSGFESLPKLDETCASEASTTPPTFVRRSKSKQPRKVGGYELSELLGQGGMGRVFRAEDSTGRFVALKLLSPDLARSPEALARFKQEGQIASQLNHPHCVFVHRVDDDSGTPFIAMELMTGQTLKDLVLQRGPLPYKEALRLTMQCIDGLIEAHSIGMIHRDIKPANCYLDDDGNVKVGDFGLARSLVSDSELTQTGAFLGTPLFASPEQLLGQSIDTRSDIYSLTATLYYLLAGKAPFESPHAAQVIAKIVSSDPPSFKSAGVNVPPMLERIVMKGLSRDISKRYASFVQMRTELEATIQPKSETASLPRRAIAWLADYFIMTTMVTIIMFSVVTLEELNTRPILANLISAVLVFLFYGLQESLFSTSFGKAAMRITVVDSKTGASPSFVRIMIRVSSFVLISSGTFLVAKLFLPKLEPGADSALAIGSFLVNLVAFYSTWHGTKKQQLLHDWISGTECRTKLGSRTSTSCNVKLPDWNLRLITESTSDRPIPASLGRFSIQGEIPTQQSDYDARWYVGRDLQLDRIIWIASLDENSIELDQSQFRKPKSMRLRLVEEGSTDLVRWFAFVAPESIPLPVCLDQGVQVPWPVTRSILGDYADLKDVVGDIQDPAELQVLERLINIERTWIDQAGRLTLVDFVLAEQKSAQASLSESRPGFIQNIALLGLPTRHRHRRKYQQSKLKTNVPSLDSLPPLRAYSFLESIALKKFVPTPDRISKELGLIDKNSHALTGRLRFLTSAVSLGLMSPLIFLAVVMLMIPAVSQTLGVYKEVRYVKTLAAFSSEPELYEKSWALVSPESKSYWTQPENQKAIQEALELQTSRLQGSLKGVGNLERFVIRAIPVLGDNIADPPMFGPRPKSDRANSSDSDAEKRNKDETRVKITAGSVTIGEANFGNELIEPKTMDEILSSVERSKLPLKRDNDFPAGLIVVIGVLLCILWTACTFGGIVQKFTGTCIVHRDGRRLGILQSFWRATLLFTPILALVFSIVYCSFQGFDYLWYETQLKRLFWIAPIVFLATTLIWPRKTPLDLLSRTVIVPR